MYYHAGARLVYLAGPKTASRATGRALVKAGFERRRHHAGPRDDYGGDPIPFEECEVATTVRDHFDALLSWWYSQTFRPGGRKPGEEIDVAYLDRVLATPYFPRRGEWWGLHRYDADVLLRYENLDTELGTWLLRHGIRPVDLDRTNVSKDRSAPEDRIRSGWRELPGPVRTEVLTRFYDEIRELGYLPRKEARAR